MQIHLDRLAVTPMPPGTTWPMVPLLVAYRLTKHPLPPGATPVNQVSTGLGKTHAF